MTWQERALILSQSDLSWRQIADIVKQPKSTVSDFLRKQGQEIIIHPAIDLSGLFEEDVGDGQDFVDWNGYVDMSLFRDGVIVTPHDNERILFVSDIHAPYHHEFLLEFLESLKNKYDPTRVIFLGDELDKHAMSFHDSDPDLPSAGDELLLALPTIAALKELFPVADIIDSNHGSMVYRKAKHHGIPRRYIRSYNDVLEVDAGWKWHMDLTLDLSSFNVPDVYVHHGKSADVVKLSQAMGMSAVQGHYHEKFAIGYWANPHGLYFGMQCGCLIDDKKLAFAYNNANLKRPIVGTGLIIEGVPVLEAMPL